MAANVKRTDHSTYISQAGREGCCYGAGRWLRKDLAVGMLVPLALSPEQLTIAVIVLTLYFTCAATFAVLFNELYARDMVKAAAVMILTALAVGGILNLILIKM